jgi:hypothetical protein
LARVRARRWPTCGSRALKGVKTPIRRWGRFVDVVAYVTRQAILEPENDVIHGPYAHLRDNLRTERDGQALRLVSGGSGVEQELDDSRYRLVL